LALLLSSPHELSSLFAQREDEVEEFAVRSAYPALSFDSSRLNPSPTSRGNHQRQQAHESQQQRRVVLIHDPTSLTASQENASSSSSSEGIVSALISFRDPVVLIVSDVVGKDDCYHEIQQIIPKQEQQRSGVRYLTLSPLSVSPPLTLS
jgi:hypothetical protein